MKYAVTDKNGFPTAFYAKDIHGDSIPTDAIEITEEQWQECVAHREERKIVVDKTGKVSLKTHHIQGPTHEEMRARLKDAIDLAAGQARARFISPGILMDQEYLATEIAAQRYKEANYPQGEAPLEVRSWMESYGLAEKEATDGILARADGMRKMLAIIRDIRMKGKAAVSKADMDYIPEAAKPFLDKLKSLAPEIAP